MKKRFGFYFDQSERRNEFLTREKIVSSNHKPWFKRIVFSQAFPRSSRVALSGDEPRLNLKLTVSQMVHRTKFTLTKDLAR